MLKNILENPQNLTPDEARASVTKGVVLAAVVALVVLILAWVFAASEVDPYGPFAVVQTAVRAHLVVVVTGIARFTVAVGLALGAFQVLENSGLGQRIESRAMALAALLVCAGLVFAR